MTETPLIYYSRSAVTTDWTCERKRWWAYEYDGKGLASDVTNLALYLGTCIHDGLAAIARGADIESIATAAATQMRDSLRANPTAQDGDAETFAQEQAALTEGLLRGFHRHVWPRLMREYPEIICVEKELTYPHDSLIFQAREDLILKDTQGQHWYFEFKTTKWSNDQWVNSWPTAVQLHSAVRAAEHTLGIPITGVIVQGLFKGYIAYGKQTSPFCYAYHKAGNPPFTKDDFIYEYKAGYRKYPVWLREGGVKRWVDEMPEHILAAQYPQVPPIFINDDLVDAFFRQRAEREMEIAVASRALNDPEVSDVVKQQVLDVSFPQHFEACQPGWGSGCEFKRLCFGKVEEPLKAGFSYRVNHHHIEADDAPQV